MPRVSSRPYKVVATSSLPSSDEEGGGNGLQMSEAARTLFEQYMSALGTQDARDSDGPSDQVFKRGMARVTEFLSSTGSDAAVCLICLSNIKPSEAVWSCSSSCFAVLHLPCIQEWARNQVDACVLRLMNESEEAHGEAPLTAAQARAAAEWGCPKCRQQYPASELPRTYTCFCGKVEDPEWDPWVAPHTCGELCGKPLTSSTTGASIKGENDAAAIDVGDGGSGKQADQGCGHKCLLLCHPGPCPPCPRIVDASCFCGKRRSKRRCGHQAYSCGRPCGKIQPCGHPCSAPCHPPGCCPPCKIMTERPCACGAERRQVACCEGVFHCNKPCGRRLACGNHVCEQVCHAGPCGECPHQGVRTCPCGKAVYPELKCTEKAPTCGATCGKLLPCGLHTCHDRCHHGECSSCRALVSKPCRCGKMTREVLCGAELLCDRRCTKLRSCTRHPCKRRCCDGTSCPPCEEKCGRWLKCGNHKCPAPCHAGPCRPCPLTVSFQCACGQGQYSVPCGAESKVVAPRCNIPCPVPGLCRHAQQNGTVRHRCHYGPCPPCMQPCGTPLPCGHLCPVPGCHDPPPPTIAPFQQPQAPKAHLVSVPAPAPRTGPAPLPEGTRTTTVVSLAQEGSRSSTSTKAKGSTKNRDGGAQNGNHSTSNAAKGASGEGPNQTPAPALVAAMVAAEVLAASPLWGPPGSPNSGVPNWPSQCPPCAAPVTVSCLGDHEQREVPCSVARPYSCTRPCGRPLACGNHRCCQPCHAVEGPGANAGTVVQQQWGWGPTGWVRGPDIVRGMPDWACEPCTLPCMKERACPHKCPLGCHIGPCPPCDVPVSRPCHCGKTTLSLPCHVMRQQMLRVAPLAAAAASGKPLPAPGGQEDLLSCQKPCHRALPRCPHFCMAPCHLGPCPHPEACQEQVTVRCECKRVRAKWACASVQAALAASRGGSGAYDATTPLRLLPCGPECPTTLQQQQQQQQQAEQELQQQRKEQGQQHDAGQAMGAKSAERGATAPGSTKQIKAPPSAPPAPAAANGVAKKQKAAAAAAAAADQNGSEASQQSEASIAAAAAAAGAGAGVGTKGSRHMSKAEKQAAAEKRRLEQEWQERTKRLQSIAMWVIIVLVGLALGMLGPKLLS